MAVLILTASAQENPMGYYLPPITEEITEEEQECRHKIFNWLHELGVKDNTTYTFEDGTVITFPGSDCVDLIDLWLETYRIKKLNQKIKDEEWSGQYQ